MKRIALVLVFLALGSPAHAGFESGASLKEMCDAKGWQEVVCGGYIVGVQDTIEILAAAKAIDPFCVPAGVTTGQLQAVVMKYIEERPEEMHITAAFLVHNALRKAFPCPQ